MLVIFDKDGTLVKPKSGATFVQSPSDQQLLVGVAERIAELREIGAVFAIASNQGGVEAGHKTLNDAIAEMRYCMGLTGINESYFCPDFHGQECYRLTHNEMSMESQDPECLKVSDFANAPTSITSFRKPGAGMIQAAMLFRLLSMANPEDSIEATYIGDRTEDREAAANAGITFIDADAWRSGAVSIAPGMVIA